MLPSDFDDPFAGRLSARGAYAESRRPVSCRDQTTVLGCVARRRRQIATSLSMSRGYLVRRHASRAACVPWTPSVRQTTSRARDLLGAAWRRSDECQPGTNGSELEFVGASATGISGDMIYAGILDPVSIGMHFIAATRKPRSTRKHSANLPQDSGRDVTYFGCRALSARGGTRARSASPDRGAPAIDARHGTLSKKLTARENSKDTAKTRARPVERCRENLQLKKIHACICHC